jgi:hypothetical protein
MLKMGERRKAESAKRSFASKIKILTNKLNKLATLDEGVKIRKITFCSFLELPVSSPT